MTTITKYTLIIAILALVGAGLYSGSYVVEVPELPVEVDFEPISVAEVPLDQEFEVWLATLAEMENCAPRGTMDSGSLSYGQFCYKPGTFEWFVRDMGMLSHVTDAELMNWIGDTEFQYELTRAVLKKYPERAIHWRTSILKGNGVHPEPLGYPPVV